MLTGESWEGVKEANGANFSGDELSVYTPGNVVDLFPRDSFSER